MTEFNAVKSLLKMIRGWIIIWIAFWGGLTVLLATAWFRSGGGW